MKPNILLIMSDEHDPAVSGAYGNPIAQTPTLDRIARNGVTFENAYCNSPLCVPSRMSFCTGRYVTRIGAFDNWFALASHEPTLAHMVRKSGYTPYLTGKMHFLGPDNEHGFELLPASYPHPVKRCGKWRDFADEDCNTRDRDRRFADFGAFESSKTIEHDLPITRDCVDFLHARKGQSDRTPYFLIAGYSSPHFPISVPEELLEKYRGRVPDPVIPEGHIESLPIHLQHIRRHFGVVETDPDLVRLGRESYYALVEWLDGEIAKILQALDESGEADNTIIIYTADHGEMLGEHGMWWKCNFFEQSSRVPLIVSWPEKCTGGQRHTQVCSLIDLSATILEMSGAEVPRWFDGDSLIPMLENTDAEWKDEAYCEYLGHGIPSPMLMLRRGQYKLNWYHQGGLELYDLESDPGEFNNLANDPAQAERIRQMQERMFAILGKTPEELDAQVRLSQEIRRAR